MRFGLLLGAFVLAGISAAQADDKLDRLTEKLKKDCEAQGGQFVLQDAGAKYTADKLGGAVPGHPGDTASASVTQPNLQGGTTAYKASGECTWTFKAEMPPPPPPTGPREVIPWPTSDGH